LKSNLKEFKIPACGAIDSASFVAAIQIAASQPRVKKLKKPWQNQ